MNLAGNPFALLQADSRRDNNSVISYEWERTLPGGKIVTASWRVTGDPELGLPGPADELLYLVLLQLTREGADGPSQEWPQVVHFSRWEVLRRLGWPDAPKFYVSLRDCFRRLSAVNIGAEHSFYNARTKAPYLSVGFHIIESFAIADEPRGRKANQTLPLSWFKWSDQLHDSFVAGNVRDLALDFIISLDHPTARRLFRYLDMMRKAPKGPPRRDFTIGVMKLRDRLGMTNYKYVSKVKEKLLSAHQELTACGYLSNVEFVVGNDGEMVRYTFGDPRSLAIDAAKSAPSTASAKLRERPMLAPEPMPSAIEERSRLLLGFEIADENDEYALLDAVYELLPQSEKDIVLAKWKSEMPEFLRPSDVGFKVGLQRLSRAHIKVHHMDKVRQLLEDRSTQEDSS